MILQLDEQDLKKIENYHLPSFKEIPDVGLYLNQCTTYINRCLEPLFGISITESMISNYVKKKIVDNPVKKQYSREVIAALLFIALSKNVTSLDNIQFLLSLQKESYDVEKAYEYFKREFETILGKVFGLDEKEDSNKQSCSVEEELLKNIIVTIAHKIYVDMAFSLLRREKTEDKE